MIGGETGVPVSNSTGPGTPMPMPHRRPGSVARVGDQLTEQLVDAGQAALRPVADVGRLVAVGDDPAVERGQRHIDARRAQVGDEDVAGVRAEGELARRSAAGARSGVTVAHQADRDQLAAGVR